ncbi:hypothetical protein Save01_08901 [Streptomyces avermitilis]
MNAGTTGLPMNTNDADAAFTTTEIHRSDDISAFTPLTSLAEKQSEVGLRLLNNALPDDFPNQVERGTAGDARTHLALGEAIRRIVSNERGSTIRDALLLGATWDQVAAALDTTLDAVADELRVWAEAQRTLNHNLLATNPDNRIGLDDAAYGETMRLVAVALEVAE